MSNAIFSLSDVYYEQIDNNWSESANYGYFAGGEAPSSVNTIDRIDFFNETVSAPDNNLTQARVFLAAVSNSNYGYFGGGNDPPIVNTIDRIDFSNETTSNPTSLDNLTEARQSLAAVSNSNYGYFGGGIAPPWVNTIDRIDFSNETVSEPSGDLTQARYALAGVSNSNYGYFGGGFAPPSIHVCTIDRLDFSNETVSASGNNLTQGRSNLAAVSNSNYGYFAGGFDPTVSPPYVNTIDRIDFSNETTSAPGNNLTEARRNLAGVSNSNYGYFGGGETPPIVNTIDRLDFSNETVSASSNNLTEARDGLAAVSGGKKINSRGPRRGADKDGKPIGSTYGYFCGPSRLDRINYSDETVSLIDISYLPESRNHLAAVSNSNYGYFAGGDAPPSVNTIDRIDFSNETASAPGNNLLQARSGPAGVSNSNYGYFGGGLDPTASPSTHVNTIDRLDFSSETVSAPGNNLFTGRRLLAAVSNSNYGYFGGGLTFSARVNNIDKLDFSNETVTGPPIHGANLTEARSQLAGVSNSNYGYFAGGLAPPWVNTIDKLDFSNETTSNPVDLENLTQARSDLAGVSNSNYGYFGGGRTPTAIPSFVNTIDRLDFSNETTSAPGNNLTQGRFGLTALSN